MKDLSKAEELVLLAIWRLGLAAYGVSIRRQVRQDSGRNYTYGTLYGLLRQLSHKRLVKKRLESPTSEQGGRGKTYFNLTAEGIQALKESIAHHKRVWKDIDELSFKRT